MLKCNIALDLEMIRNMFASTSADNIKKFSLPKGEFMHNMLSQQKTVINSMAANEDGVLATAGNNLLGFCRYSRGSEAKDSTRIRPSHQIFARMLNQIPSLLMKVGK